MRDVRILRKYLRELKKLLEQLSFDDVVDIVDSVYETFTSEVYDALRKVRPRLEDYKYWFNYATENNLDEEDLWNEAYEQLMWDLKDNL